VKTLTAGALTALASGQFPMVLLVEMQFSPVIYLASAAVDISYGGNTYLAAGSLGAVDVLRDGSGDANGLQFSLSGVPSANISLALGTSARNKKCILRSAILNATTHAIEDAPIVGTFVLDQLTVAGSIISVSAYPVARIFARAKAIRYTDGDQQLISAGDRGLEFIVSQSTRQDVWPAAAWFRK
jgi:hypothetical protein